MDLRWFINSRRQIHERRVPRNAFASFASKREMYVANGQASTSDWVSARFSPVVDDLLCLGGNDGSIGLYNVVDALGDDMDVDLNKGMLKCIRAHNGAVMGVYGVPGRKNEILSIGGDGSAKIWDMERGADHRLACFSGHVTIVRSACFAPESSDVFVTCGRDGKFCLNDRRCQSKKDRNGVEFIPPVQQVEDAHFSADFGRRYQGIKDPPGLTNIVYLDDNNIVTASDKSLTGIRFWDPRRLDGHTTRTLKVPQHRSCRQAGIASMTVDRFSSNLYVAVTDHVIYEYAIRSDCSTSVRSLLDARTNSFDITIATSPISDHLICGSTNSNCIMYDLQASHRYLDDERPTQSFNQIRPSYVFEGHDSDVSAVSWSRDGNYIVTLDNTKFRIWAPNSEVDSNEALIQKKDNLPGFQRVTYRPSTPRKNSTEAAEASLRRMSVSEESPTTKARRASLISSPGAKRIRFTNDTSPLRNLTNLPNNKPRSTVKCEYWDRPTANLPLRAAEWYDKLKESALPPKSATVSTPKRNLNDFWDSQKKKKLSAEEPQIAQKTLSLAPSAQPESKVCASPVTTKRRKNTLHHYFCQR